MSYFKTAGDKNRDIVQDSFDRWLHVNGMLNVQDGEMVFKLYAVCGRNQIPIHLVSKGKLPDLSFLPRPRCALFWGEGC